MIIKLVYLPIGIFSIINVTKSNVKSAEASYNKAEYELLDTEDTIDLEVRQAYLKL